MQRLIVYILLLMLPAVVQSWQGADVQKSTAGQPVVVVGEQGAPVVQAPSDHYRHAAVLTDARGLYRVCNTRPQRVLPHYGSSHERGAGRTVLALHQTVKPFQSPYDGRCRRESAPFCSAASCRYYVYALRHILR